MFNKLKKATSKMRDLGFWKSLAKNQGKDLFFLIAMNKLEKLVTKWMIEVPFEHLERLRKKNGYGPTDWTLLKQISKSLFGV